MPLQNLIDIEAVSVGERLNAAEAVKAKKSAEAWADYHYDNIDADSEDALSHYLESQFDLDADICDKLANNVFIHFGFKQ